jgi:hypothetical protein
METAQNAAPGAHFLDNCVNWPASWFGPRTPHGPAATFARPPRVRNLQISCSLYGKPIGRAVALRVQPRCNICAQIRMLRFGFCRSGAFRETTLQHAPGVFHDLHISPASWPSARDFGHGATGDSRCVPAVSSTRPPRVAARLAGAAGLVDCLGDPCDWPGQRAGDGAMRLRRRLD